MKLRRLYEDVRCLLGIHRLSAYRGDGESVHISPISPHVRPGQHDSRVCSWCGARWVGAFDGLAPFWRRVA